MSTPRVSIIVPVYNAVATLRACLESVFEQTKHADWELIVVDDASTDGSGAYLDTLDKIRLIRNTSRQGVARSLNIGFAAAGDNDVVRLHADVTIETPDWLTQLANVAYTATKAGIVGAKFLRVNHTIQAVGRNIVTGLGFREWNANLQCFLANGKGGKLQEVDTVPGALSYYTRKAITAVGGLDENYWPAWLEDDDFCQMARFHGFKVYVVPTVAAVHHSRCLHDTPRFLVGTDYPLRRAEALKTVIINDHYRYWHEKWGWDPFFPDVGEIRRLYGHTEICWRIGEAMRFAPKQWPPRVDACMVTWNNRQVLQQTLDSIAKTNYPSDKLTVWVVDNGSSDSTREYLDALRGTFPFRLEPIYLAVNVGAPAGLNWGFVQGDAEIVGKLDDDIQVAPNWLEVLTDDFRQRPFAASVGGKMINDTPVLDVQFANPRFWPNYHSSYNEMDRGQCSNYFARSVHVQGACTIYRRDVLVNCGLLDLRFSPSQFDDIEHHIRCNVSGYEVIYDGRVRTLHKFGFNAAAVTREKAAHVAGNRGKVHGKWGDDIYYTLERSVDLSREGRFVGPYRPNTKDGEFDYPRHIERHDVRVRLYHKTYKRDLLVEQFELKLAPPIEPELETYANDLHAIAKDQLAARDNNAIMLLGAAVSLYPWRPDLLHTLARALTTFGQTEAAQCVAARAQRFEARLISPTETQQLEATETTDTDKAQPPVITASGPKVLLTSWFGFRPKSDAETAELELLKRHLEASGLRVKLDCSPCPDATGFDLVHAWSMMLPERSLPAIQEIKECNSNIFVLLTPFYYDGREVEWAHRAIPSLITDNVFSGSTPLDDVRRQLAALATPNVEWRGVRRSEAHDQRFDSFELYQQKLLRFVDYIVPQSDDELAALGRAHRLWQPTRVIPACIDYKHFAEADKQTFIAAHGLSDFVLCSAPVGVIENQLMLLMALRDTHLPVVLVVRTADRNYLRICRRLAASTTTILEDLSDAEVASAYAAARVHVLPLWRPFHDACHLAAAAAGCSIVASNRGFERSRFGELVSYCNSADLESIRRTVVTAYNRQAGSSAKRTQIKHEIAAKHDVAVIAKQYAAYYEEVLAEWAQRPKATANSYAALVESIDANDSTESGEVISRTGT